MSEKYIDVRLFVNEEIETWEDEEIRSYKLLNRFEMVDTDIPADYWYGIGESWAQSDRYYEVIQNLVEVFDD